jgi:hypothetical protein
MKCNHRHVCNETTLKQGKTITTLPRWMVSTFSTHDRSLNTRVHTCDFETSYFPVHRSNLIMTTLIILTKQPLLTFPKMGIISSKLTGFQHEAIVKKIAIFFFFFFLHVHTREGEKIRISDFRFMRCCFSRLSYPLRTKCDLSYHNSDT